MHAMWSIEIFRFHGDTKYLSAGKKNHTYVIQIVINTRYFLNFTYSHLSKAKIAYDNNERENIVQYTITLHVKSHVINSNYTMMSQTNIILPKAVNNCYTSTSMQGKYLKVRGKYTFSFNSIISMNFLQYPHTTEIRG